MPTYSFKRLFKPLWINPDVPHLCSRPRPQVEGRRWGCACGGEPVSTAPWSARQRNGWTGTYSPQGGWSGPEGFQHRGARGQWVVERKKNTQILRHQLTWLKKRKRPAYLHLRVHAVVDCSSPGIGWTSSNNTITTGGQKCSLVLIEGLQGRVVAWGLKLEPGARDENIDLKTRKF